MTAPCAAFGDLFCPPSFVKNSVMSTAVTAFCNKVPCKISESVSLVFPFEHKGIGCTARWELVGAEQGCFVVRRWSSTSPHSWRYFALLKDGRGLGPRLAAHDGKDVTQEQPRRQGKAQGAGWEMGTEKNPHRWSFSCFSSECGALEAILFPGPETFL